MSFISLPTGKLHKKTETKKLKIFPAGYVVDFTATLQIMLIARLMQIFMEELPTTQTYHWKMLKYIF